MGGSFVLPYDYEAEYLHSDGNQYFILPIHANSLTDVTGNIYCIRIYDRELTAQEILANQAVDNTRFNLGLTFE